ncbi:MAG: DUF2065 domain-containing protein [Devosia sp.]|nr:DUF2065 domain-containing protein [Devosia sp.]
MSDFLAALALALMIEGLVYAAFPDQVKKWLAQLVTQPTARIRAGALACAAVGLILLWVVRG